VIDPSSFFDHHANEEKLNKHIMQENAMAHSVCNASDGMLGI
jgi:hypothetical protein